MATLAAKKRKQDLDNKMEEIEEAIKKFSSKKTIYIEISQIEEENETEWES
jgi:hypothetical protein